jgi:hypothetical protein
MEHVTRIIKTRTRINSNKVKGVGTVAPAEAGIPEKMTRRGIPETEIGRSQVL